jgi:hypothetical protein
MLTIEFTPGKSVPCPCCGRESTNLTRFVYRDGDAYAIYKAMFSESHPNRIVLATVSLGPWDGDATADQRVAFALKLTPAPTQYEVQVVDAASSPWRDSETLGRTLDRAEALDHPALPEVYAIADRMVADDRALNAYLGGP